MANKLSIVVKIKDDKILDTLTVHRRDCGDAIKLFKEWREQGFEAYLFQAPEADKRAKQEVVVETPTVVDKFMNSMTKKKPSSAVSLEIE